MLINICHHCYKPLSTTSSAAECCKCYTPCPDGVVSTNCIKYNLYQPDADSELECLGIANGTSLYTIILEIYRRILNRVKVVNSDSVDIHFECGILSMNLKIDSDSTLPYSIGPNGLKLNCCQYDCSSLTYDFDFDITKVDRLSDFYNRTDDSYFCLSDTLTNIYFTDNSYLFGDVVSYFTYTDLLDLGSYTFYQAGDNFVMPVSICARTLENITKQFIFEAFTKKGCYVYKICDFSIEKVNYSEFVSYCYRANPQINDMPIRPTPGINPSIDKGILYFCDSIISSGSVSAGGSVRKVYLNSSTGLSARIETIAGTTNLISINTLNNKWGTDVVYDYNASVNLDMGEMQNNEPAVYFTSFNGAFCKLIKERDTECDERFNWKNYVIAGKIVNDINIHANTGSGLVPAIGNTVSGDNAIFTRLYGSKRWFDINGKPSFILMDSYSGTMLFVYYSGNGNVNASSSWLVSNIGLRLTGNNVNINIEDSPLVSDGGRKRIWVLNSNPSGGLGITSAVFVITFPILNPTLSDILNISNYTGSNRRAVVDLGAPATFPNSNSNNFPNTGAVVKLHGPNQIQRIDTLSGYYYVVSNGNDGVSGICGIGSCDTSNWLGDLIKIEEAATPVNSSSYYLSKLIDTSIDPSIPNGTKGLFSTQCNAKVVQGFFKDLQSNYYDMSYGGFRLYDFANSEILGFPTSITNASATKLAKSNICCEQPINIDSLYRHVLNCDVLPCDQPELSIINITSSSMVIVILNYNPLYSYDLSVDGGVSFSYVGISNPYTLIGLSAATPYAIVVKVHCGIGTQSISNTYNVSTITNIPNCAPFYYTVSGITQTSCILNITSPVVGELYSVSLDGGVTYVIINTSNPNIFVSGLTPNTTYNIVIKKQDLAGLFCYSNYTIKTLVADTFCIEVIKTLIAPGTYTITATLKNQLGFSVNAIANLAVPLYLYSNALNSYIPVSLTIFTGNSSANLNVLAAVDAIICYDPNDYTGCSSSNIFNPCLCNVDPCPCLGCLTIIDLGDPGFGTGHSIKFEYHDCYGNVALAPYPIVISFTCGFVPSIVSYTITIPSGSSSITNNFLVCDISNIALTSVTNNIRFCPTE